MDSDYTLKILTIGESGVGKTCILLRYTDNKFVKTHLTTIGIDYKSKLIQIGDTSVRLKIWDTAGQERFRNITTQYYKNADGILLVYDVSDKTTLDKISQWMNQIKINNTNENVVVLVVGNKCDVETRQVSKEEAIAVAKEYGLNYFETSALTNYNIDAAFAYLAEEIIKMKSTNKNQIISETTKKPAVKLEEINLQNDELKLKEKKCC